MCPDGEEFVTVLPVSPLSPGLLSRVGLGVRARPSRVGTDRRRGRGKGGERRKASPPGPPLSMGWIVDGGLRTTPPVRDPAPPAASATALSSTRVYARGRGKQVPRRAATPVNDLVS
ncbi:hypothetical protein GCM10009605_20290 [Nocardiopsis composta]